MPSRDPRVDDYIARAAEFARPVLSYLREIVHAACPDVEETLKWGMPTFMYHGMLCTMAAHKQHCSFGFRKPELVFDAMPATRDDGMGQFGRIASVADLPPREVLEGHVRKAATVNAEGVKAPAGARRAAPKPAVAVPDDLVAALAGSEPARLAFERFSPSHRREYVEWITEARRPETRERRIATALEWLAEGKSRNWKHERR